MSFQHGVKRLINLLDLICSLSLEKLQTYHEGKKLEG